MDYNLKTQSERMELESRKLLAENEELRTRLEEAEEALSAIRGGEVDALVISSGEGEKIFTLEGADQPYRVLVETMSEGAATLSEDGAVLYCNSRLADMLGLPLERVLGKPLLSHVAPEHASDFRALLEKALGGRNGEIFRAEISLLAENENYVPVLLSCRPLDLSGNPGISLIVTDLSEQRRIEEIVAAGELASSILEQAGEAIIVCDEAGRVIRASRQSHELFGLNLIFLPFDQLGTLREHRTGETFSISAPLSGQNFRGLEIEFQRQNRQFHLLLNARPLLRQKKILGCVVTLTDITERKRNEEELVDAKQAAEEASRAKSEFLANMSHEIRTPMTVFMAAIEQLLHIDRNPERRRLLEMADQSALRLRNLIEDILDFSRIEARKVDIEEKPFDLRACMRDAVEMFAIPAREKNLGLETEVAPSVPDQIIGDSSRLGQVLINLIGNAVKFTEKGEIRVSVQRRDNLLEFAVADTGIGIPKGKTHALFESFSQADGSFHRRYGGSGLGLTISKGLVEMMGGEISVLSREEEGSVFTFTLPLKTELQSSPEKATSKGEQEFSSARILVAEDEPVIREMIGMMLAKRGCRAETVETGREAMEKWAEKDFDLILMDLQMPEMDGLEATRAIREKEAEGENHTFIIGLTAHARRDIQQECLAAGMDKVLSKPVKMKMLFSVIDKYLGHAAD